MFLTSPGFPLVFSLLASVRTKAIRTMTSTLSIVTPCFNDFEALQATLASLGPELRENDELLVVDSSTNATIAPRLLGEAGLRCRCRYLWSPPLGVYNAQNLGVQAATNLWIQILNSGDLFLPCARHAIDEAIAAHPDIDLHVFRQQTAGALDGIWVFAPDGTGIWPHQSIITRRTVHDRLGLYAEEYRLISDQLFFAQARRHCPWKLHTFVLTRYDLGGISSRASWRASHEHYTLWRALGRGRLASWTKSYLTPLLRVLLQRLVGKKWATSIKHAILPWYRHARRPDISGA